MMTPLRSLARGTPLIAAASIAACKSGTPKGQTPPAPVRVATAQRIDAPVTIMASGVVEPIQTVAVTTQVSGSLLDVLFHEGDFVQSGQVLFRIDQRPLQAAVDEARAALSRDMAQADASGRDDVRYKTLADMGYVSRSQSDQMHATALAQAATVRADEASLRSAQVNLGFTTIRAPIAGRTGSLLVRRGNNVSPGTGALVVINQLRPVLVRFPVLEQDFAPLQRAVAGQALPVTAASGDSTQAIEHGELSFLDNAIDSLTGTVTGKATFQNEGRRMWPGELMFLSVQLEVQHGVVAVPSEAIQTGQQGPYVFVVDAKNTAQTRPVVPGIQVGDLTVVQRGVTSGERVVIDGQSRLSPGGRVALVAGPGTDTGATLHAVTGGGSAAGDVVAGRAGAAGSAAAGENSGRGARGGATSAPTPGTVSAGVTTASPGGSAGRGATTGRGAATPVIPPGTATTSPSSPSQTNGTTTPTTSPGAIAVPTAAPPTSVTPRSGNTTVGPSGAAGATGTRGTTGSGATGTRGSTGTPNRP